MNEQFESICIKAIDAVLSQKYSMDEYSLNGNKESSVCLDRMADNWIVYEFEHGVRFDLVRYDTIIEACFEMIRRMCGKNEVYKMKTDFCTRLFLDSKLTA
jgi:hypothetical protein